jgi:hypothetical protein
MNRSSSVQVQPRRRPSARRVGSMLLGAGLLAVTALVGVPAVASASTVCDPGGDVCVVYPDSVQTPLGLVSVTVSSGNVVSVHLSPTSSSTVVIGVPFTLPIGWLPGCPGGCSRTTIDTPGGLVSIDTIVFPPGPPTRFTLPSVAIISVHPPGPCRASTTGTTVTFTPIQFPPGPPG